MTSTQLTTFESVLNRTPIELRRWFVGNYILGPQDALKGVLRDIPVSDISPSLIRAAHSGSTSEHQGIASRFLFDWMDQPTLTNGFPTFDQPKTWNQAETMLSLIFWLYKPWMEYRYDPESETAHVCMANNQWRNHLKGKDSDGVLTVRLQQHRRALGEMSFIQIASLMTGMHEASESFGKRPIASADPRHYNMDAQEFAQSFALCEAAFNKFMNRASAVKELLDQLQREPLMFFNTSVLNSMVDMAAFGNGVIATKDILDDETGHPVQIAGRLIDTDPEFMLGSATGMEWKTDKEFDEYMTFREHLHHGSEHVTWDEWWDGLRQYAHILLNRDCRTYDAFLKHAFPSSPDETPAERDAFLRLLGAAVFGSNLKIVATMIGAPNAGKDTVLKWLTMLMGQGQVGVLSPTALTPMADDQRAFAPLKGARVAVVSGEVGEGRGQAILAEKLKSVTSGGGTLTVAEKYEKPTTIFFDGMLIMQGNSVPAIIGGDQALYKNRLVAVEFRHPFPLQAMNYDPMYRREAPNFLKVLFLHYLDYQKRGGGMLGIDPPPTWQNFASDVEFNADALAVIDRCLTSPDANQINIPSTTFYKALSILAERHLGLRHGLSAMRWAARLKRAGVNLSKEPNNPFRTQVNRADYRGWMFHFTLNADESDGLFTQADWESALSSASMVT